MEVPYQLICLDLDGTLLESRSYMDPETIKVLRKIEGLGVSIAIVTGRPAFDAKYHAKSISENTYFIGSNGAVVGRVGRKGYFSNIPMKNW